jgi:hypothetical protein
VPKPQSQSYDRLGGVYPIAVTGTTSLIILNAAKPGNIPIWVMDKSVLNANPFLTKRATPRERGGFQISCD